MAALLFILKRPARAVTGLYTGMAGFVDRQRERQDARLARGLNG